jgi:hypothetical protein
LLCNGCTKGRTSAELVNSTNWVSRSGGLGNVAHGGDFKAAAREKIERRFQNYFLGLLAKGLLCRLREGWPLP